MNPRSKNSKNTTIASARKKYGNERTKPQGKKKTACFGLRNRKPEGHLHAARPRKPQRILSKTKKRKRKEMQQATTNMRSHSRIAKPEGSAPRAPTHRSGGRPWVSRRNPSTPCRETEDLQHHRTYLAEKNQAIQTQTQRKPTRRSQTNNSNPTWRMKATEKVRPPAG